MTSLAWRSAVSTDAAAIVDLFRTVSETAPVGLETTETEVQARLAAPRLNLEQDTLVAVDTMGSIRAFAETADMGIGQDTMRIRLTSAINPILDSDCARRTHQWLLDRSAQMRTERHPELPGILGARCADTDGQRFSLLAEAGFQVVYRHEDLIRSTGGDLSPVPGPAQVRVVPYLPALDEAVWVTHNEAYASDPSALRPDRSSWPQHAVGLPSFLPQASFLAVTGHDQVVAFLFSLEHRDATGTREAALHCLGTHPAWRKRSIATSLIAHTLAIYEKCGLGTARLQVRDSNIPAMRLYRRLGFTESGDGYSVLQAPLP